jgi:hypothetical protein
MALEIDLALECGHLLTSSEETELGSLRDRPRGYTDVSRSESNWRGRIGITIQLVLAEW